MSHTHQLVYLCEAVGDIGGAYIVRWCRDCGTVVMFSGSSAYEMIPAMSKVKKDEKVEFVKDKSSKKKLTQRALGRSFTEVMANAKSMRFPGLGDEK